MMEVEEATIAMLVELKRLRVEGVREIFLSDQSLEGLKEALGSKNAQNSHDRSPEKEQVRSNKTPENSLQPSSVDAQSDAGDVSSDFVIKKTEAESDKNFPENPPVSLPKQSKKEQWAWLREKVLSCETCNAELNPDGKVVFGMGNLDADIFFCGEAPGAEEELQGLPFVGPAGELLNKIIEAMGLTRENVYVGNILNWRPKHNQQYGNRPPTWNEMSFCLPYLKAQLQIVQPKVIVALGKTATDGLLGLDKQRRLSDVRGKWNAFEDIPLMVTYHPSYLLHNPSNMSKRKVWEDMLLVMERMNIPISEKQRGFFL